VAAHVAVVAVRRAVVAIRQAAPADCPETTARRYAHADIWGRADDLDDDEGLLAQRLLGRKAPETIRSECGDRSKSPDFGEFGEAM